jgi:glutathione peroxidase
LTPRDYPQLVALHDEFAPRGFAVLAFPCNQFGSQEPHDAKTIRAFADKYDAKFPMFAKVDVNGKFAHPVYRFLKSKIGGLAGSSIKWNFTKFLVDGDGKPVHRYGPPTAPNSIKNAIEKALVAEGR